MALEADLYNFLSNEASITALVSTRIFPVRVPQAQTTKPCITYTRISGQRIRDFDGEVGIENPRIQIDCWANTFASAFSVADAVRLKLDGKRGNINSNFLYGCYLDDERHSFVTPKDASDKGVYRISVDYIFWHTETAATPNA